MRSCESAVTGGGTIGSVSTSCKEESACEDTARYEGSTGDISGSCVDSFACYGMHACESAGSGRVNDKVDCKQGRKEDRIELCGSP